MILPRHALLDTSQPRRGGLSDRDVLIALSPKVALVGRLDGEEDVIEVDKHAVARLQRHGHGLRNEANLCGRPRIFLHPRLTAAAREGGDAAAGSEFEGPRGGPVTVVAKRAGQVAADAANDPSCLKTAQSDVATVQDDHERAIITKNSLRMKSTVTLGRDHGSRAGALWREAAEPTSIST
jgi:hypothetical protein